MKKSIAILLGMAFCLFIISCPNPAGANKKEFKTAPALQMIPVDGGFAYSWQDPKPSADSVDLHWRVSQGPVESVKLIWEFGYVRKDVQQSDTIAVSLKEGEYFSAFIAVHKAGYANAYSNVVVKMSDEVFSNIRFDYPPVLTVTPGVGSLICTWTSAYPFPNSYDLYYAEGNFTSVARVKAEGVRVPDCVHPDATGASISSGFFEYTIGSLDNSKVYSVVITAERMGYLGIDSAVLANQKPW